MRVFHKAREPITIRPTSLLTTKQVIDILQSLCEEDADRADWAVITQNNQTPEFRLHPCAMATMPGDELHGVLEITGIDVLQLKSIPDVTA